MSKKSLVLPLLVIFAFAFNACDDTFTPVSEEYLDNYSIFGYLDAESDTQWVRIMPIKETINQVDFVLPEKVTLTAENGQLITLNPKELVFTIQGTEKSVWNYWTDEPINKNESYLLQAIHPNGEITESYAHIPADFATPSINGNLLTFGMLDTLADVRISWVIQDYVNDETIRISFSEKKYVHWSEARQEYRGFINPNKTYLKIAELFGFTEPYLVTQNGDIEVVDTQISVVQAGNGWVDFFEMDRDEIAVETIQSNVNNGVGFFVGSVIKRLPFPVCVGDAGDIVVCEGS